MNAGIAYLIHDKEEYEKNKKKIIKAIEKKNLDLDYIYDASVVEFRGDMYLIIDGHTAFLDDNRFVDKLSKITCPLYKEEKDRMKSMDKILEILLISDEVERIKDKLDKKHLENYYGMMEIAKKLNLTLETYKREHLFTGQFYGEESPIIYKFFGIESEKELLDKLAEDIFKASSEKVSVGEVQFVETLYQMEV